MGSAIAWLDRTRHLRLQRADGRRVDTRPPVAWGSWADAASEDVHSWPTWSPDGQQVATFRIGRERGLECTVHVSSLDGVTAAEVAELRGRLPIYLQWSPDASLLRVLTQAGDELHLEQASVDPIGSPQALMRGSPLFFVADDDRVVAFVGGDDGPELQVWSPTGSRRLPGVPGNFCAPMIVGERVLYVIHGTSGMELVSASLDPEEQGHRVYAPVHGLASLVASPRGDRVAWAVDPAGSGAAYRGLSLLDPDTGDSEQLTDLPLVAYLWQPDGLGLVGAEPLEAGLLRWHHIGLDGYTRPLGDLFATRDLRFYLRFFEQFSGSHPLIDADSEHLLLAGGLTDHAQPRSTPRIWRISLLDGGVEQLDEGMFATWAPRSS